MAEPTSSPHYSSDGTAWWDGQEWHSVSVIPPRHPARTWVALAASVLVLLVSGSLLYDLSRMGGGHPSSSQQSQASSSSYFSKAIACSANNYDPVNQICNRDDSRHPFSTDYFICSAQVNNALQKNRKEQISYDSHEVLSHTVPIQENVSTKSVGYSLGSGKSLPGGVWKCSLSIDSVVKTISVIIDGPSGEILYASVCSSNDVQRIGPILCEKDEPSIVQPTSVACTAMLRNLTDKAVEIRLSLYGSEQKSRVITSAGVANTTLYNGFIVADSLDFVHADVMTPGNYSCTWSVSGQVVARKDFQVT
jgi:hypothetical protein